MIENLRGYWAYRVIDKHRLSNPKRTLELAKLAARRVDERLLPWVLGSCGAALRRMGLYFSSLEVLVEAADLARTHGDRRALEKIRIHLAHVCNDLGDGRAALRHTLPVLVSAVQDENQEGKGRALAVLAKWFHHLEEFDESLRSNRAALRLLPKTDHDYRFGALLGNAYTYEEMGDLEAADLWAGLAVREGKKVRPAMLASLLLHQGLLAKRRGLHDIAAHRFDSAFEFYVERGFYHLAAIAAVELCESLKITGQHEAVIETALATVELVGHLKDSPLVRGIISELVERASTGRPITLRFLDGLRKRLKESTNDQPPGSG